MSYTAVCFNYFLSMAIFGTQIFHKVVYIATHLRCGRIFKYDYVAKLLLSLLTFGEVMGRSLLSCFFGLTVYMVGGVA